MIENDPAGNGLQSERRWALALTFAAGFLVQTAQIVLLRELLMAFSGLEVVIGIALASWMFLVALGGFGAAALLRRNRRPASILAHALGAAFLPLGASALLARWAPTAFGLASGELPGLGPSLLMTLAVLAPTALTAGALFVASSKALEEARPEGKPGGAVGWAYLVEAGGSAVAGALFSFLLVEVLGPFRILFFASVAVGALAGVRRIREERGPAVWTAALLVAAASAAFLGGAALDRATARWRWTSLQGDAELAGIRDSRYGRIAVTRYGGQSNFFVSGQLAFSLPDRAGAAALAHGVLCEHPSPESLLLVGGGVSGLVRECLKHPIDRLEYVELDPLLIETAKTFEPAETASLSDPRVRVVDGDGRAHVKRALPSVFDVVLVSVPDPETAAMNRYYTREFFEEVKGVLAPGGIAAFTLSGAENYLGKEILSRNGTIYHTFLKVFPHVLVWPGETFLFFGTETPGRLTHEPERLAQRFLERKIRFPLVCSRCSSKERDEGTACPACGAPLVEADWFSVHHFELLLQEDDVFRVNRALRNWPVETVEADPERAGGKRALPDFMTGVAREETLPWEEEIPPADRRENTDANPRAILQNLLLWNRVMGESGWTGAIEIMSGLAGYVWLLLVGIFLLPMGIAAAKGRRAGAWPFRFGLAVVVGIVGYSELAIEMVVLLAFQNQYGFVYREMGVLFGVFMLGLGVGGWVGLTRLPRRPLTIVILLAATAAFVILLPAALSGLRGLPPAPAFLLYLVFATTAGVPVGLLFPVVAGLHAGEGRGAGGTAAVLYGADLLGGIGGALLAGPLLLPVMGISRLLCHEIAPLLGAGALVLGAGWALSRREEPEKPQIPNPNELQPPPPTPV